VSNAVISPLPAPGARAEIAAAVRAHIAARRTNDSRVARAIGMSQPKFSRRTNEDVAFDSDDLGRIADHFGITVVELVQMPRDGTVGGGRTLLGLTRNRTGWKLPHLDSNQEPIGFKHGGMEGQVISLDSRRFLAQREGAPLPSAVDRARRVLTSA
jgi:predicted XRE-type DNA-binding protein